ncbi:MAG: hypothetical protein GXY86_05705 [Firmicutes bacterium]|jgi:hypothetical protein|nr:hypothetical protein [Bacillota bacterium]
MKKRILKALDWALPYTMGFIFSIYFVYLCVKWGWVVCGSKGEAMDDLLK